MHLFTFTHFRILLLLFTLVFAALYTLNQKFLSTSWDKPLEVVIFPINGDNKQATENYIQALQNSNFEPINQWLTNQAAVYSMGITSPARFHMGGAVSQLPPILPKQSTPLGVVWWGLKMRWWAFRNTPDSTSNLDRVRLFVIYQQGTMGEALPHSLGLEKGLLGVIYAYANEEQNNQNNIVIAHEFLHTVGATDKYNRYSSAVFPQGFANPEQRPLYPQKRAEIMSGHIPTTESNSQMALSLTNVVLNPYTAREIAWLKK